MQEGHQVSALFLVRSGCRHPFVASTRYTTCYRNVFSLLDRSGLQIVLQIKPASGVHLNSRDHLVILACSTGIDAMTIFFVLSLFEVMRCDHAVEDFTVAFERCNYLVNCEFTLKYMDGRFPAPRHQNPHVLSGPVFSSAAVLLIGMVHRLSGDALPAGLEDPLDEWTSRVNILKIFPPIDEFERFEGLEELDK